jgi:hypothetical protein
MTQFINRLKLVFLVLFAVGCVGVWTYQLMYARPRALCEARHGWWDWHERVCAQPIPLWVLTHRGGGETIQKLAPGMATPKGPSDLGTTTGAAPAPAGPSPARP